MLSNLRIAIASTFLSAIIGTLFIAAATAPALVQNAGYLA